MLFQPFKKATRPETPGYVHAEISRANHEALAKNRENTLRSQNLLGGAELYNAGMGDRSPIADAMFGPEEAAIAETAASTVPGLAAGASPVGLSASAAGGVGAAGITPAAGTAAATPAATGALASLGPAGWAALAGMMLMNM